METKPTKAKTLFVTKEVVNLGFVDQRVFIAGENCQSIDLHDGYAIVKLKGKPDIGLMPHCIVGFNPLLDEDQKTVAPSSAASVAVAEAKPETTANKISLRNLTGSKKK